MEASPVLIQSKADVLRSVSGHWGKKNVWHLPEIEIRE
jgi:hypothetical protein